MYKDVLRTCPAIIPLTVNSSFRGVLVLVLVAATFWLPLRSLMQMGRDLLTLMLLTHAIGN